MNNFDDNEIIVILIVESCTGKTNLINTAIGLNFRESEPSTTSTSYVPKLINIGDKSYTINLWDTISKESFHPITKLFLKDSNIIILVYDITKLKTFEKLDYWFQEIKDNLDDTSVIGIIGNKQDLYLKEEVSEKKAKEYATEKKSYFKLTSAKDPVSFISALEDLTKKYIEKNKKIVKIFEKKEVEEEDNSFGKEKKYYTKNLFFNIKYYSL